MKPIEASQHARIAKLKVTKVRVVLDQSTTVRAIAKAEALRAAFPMKVRLASNGPD
jgi:hypothetical protein